MGARERPRQPAAIAVADSCRSGTRQCAAVPVVSTNDGAPAPSGAGLPVRAAINDLDETLTVSASFLTPPMQRAYMEVPSVEGDQTAVQQRASPGAGAEARFGGAGRRWRRWPCARWLGC